MTKAIEYQESISCELVRTLGNQVLLVRLGKVEGKMVLGLRVQSPVSQRFPQLSQWPGLAIFPQQGRPYTPPPQPHSSGDGKRPEA